jgi:hypothetical protein
MLLLDCRQTLNAADDLRSTSRRFQRRPVAAVVERSGRPSVRAIGPLLTVVVHNSGGTLEELA